MLEPASRRDVQGVVLRAAPSLAWTLATGVLALLGVAGVLARAPGGVGPASVLGDAGGFGSGDLVVALAVAAVAAVLLLGEGTR